VIELRAAASPGEVRIAAVEADSVLDYALWRPGAPDGIGDLWGGRVTALVPAMAGAFVALGEATGFLPDSEGARGLTEGQIVAVRITRSAQGGKGPRLSARDLPPAPEAGLLRRGPDPLAELAARYPAAPVMVDDHALLAALRPTLGDRARYAPAVFTDAQAAALDALEHPDLTLPNGARLSIHPTPALVAIDVDAGRTTAERVGKARQQAGLNAAVIPALAAQLRLRNLSGAIVVDFAGLSVRRRAMLGPALETALAADPLHPRFLGFTALGLAEILRPRIRPPLHELLAGPHAAGLAALRALVSGTDPDPRRRPVLRASPAVVAALQADPVALPDLVRRLGREPVLRADPSLPPDGWTMDPAHV
jgi:Ribonuclease G/E